MAWITDGQAPMVSRCAYRNIAILLLLSPTSYALSPHGLFHPRATLCSLPHAPLLSLLDASSLSSASLA
jgi:hypothetical protein